MVACIPQSFLQVLETMLYFNSNRLKFLAQE